MRRTRGIAAAVALAATIALPASAPAGTLCTAPPPEGGEWIGYGNGPANTRSQPEETLISPTNAAGLEAKWTFSLTANAIGGQISGTPAVVGGCVIVTSGTANSGFVTAIDLASGELVWRVTLPNPGGVPINGLAGHGLVGTPGFHGDLVIAYVSTVGATNVYAIDRTTGAIAWGPTLIGTHPQAFVIASPVVYDGLVFIGTAANEASTLARGGYAILDASTGAIVLEDWTIPDADYPKYAGASIWCSPAVDDATGFVYACGGNPASKRFEHRHANALLKIDVRRTVGGSANLTFGKIVDAYKGNADQYFSGLDQQPACDAFGDNAILNTAPWSAACLQMDLDFGASPALFRDADGSLLVGALQKSGVYHTAYADTMTRAWNTAVGVPCFPCNAATAAVDEGKIYMLSAPPGQMVALSRTLGRLQWVSPVGDGIHFQPVTTAFGVVYGMDTRGFLNVIEAATGLPVLIRPLVLDTGVNVSGNGSNGVAVAGNRVIATAVNWVVAYGLP